MGGPNPPLGDPSHGYSLLRKSQIMSRATHIAASNILKKLKRALATWAVEFFSTAHSIYM